MPPITFHQLPSTHKATQSGNKEKSGSAAAPYGWCGLMLLVYASLGWLNSEVKRVCSPSFSLSL